MSVERPWTTPPRGRPLGIERMLIVLASRSDRAAAALVERWSPHGARLLTPADLSIAGWRFRPGSSHAGDSAVAQGRPLAVDEIGAVVTRLPLVFEQDLDHIAPADRAYVAAEMSAFLLAWLTALPCPVLNRPTATCLSGPFWRPEQWVYTAAGLGIPVAPVRRKVTLGAAAAPDAAPLTSGTVITLVDGHSVAPAEPLLVDRARRLAAAAGTALLAVEFSDPGPDGRFIAASPWPDVADPAVADALLARLAPAHRPVERVP